MERGISKVGNRTLAAAVLLSVMLIACACGESTSLTVDEAAAISEICGADAADFKDISREVLTKERTEKFTAVSKVYRYGELYAFIVKPVAYNGPLTIALVINGAVGESIGIRIIEHTETQHYVRDMDSSWFTGRFANKSTADYLSLVRLSARDDRDIVAITGATVTTEAVINGVNAAFGAFNEFVLGQTAGAVPYMVRFEPGHGEGPVETESITIRAYGIILAEVSLEDIRALPSVRRTMSIHSTGGVTQHSFRGTLLSNVLDFADPGIREEYSRALAVGVDDYISGISMEEIKGENSVYVMYEDNDEPLLKKNGEAGAMRIVVVNDVFGQRFTNYLLEVSLESEAAW